MLLQTLSNKRNDLKREKITLKTLRVKSLAGHITFTLIRMAQWAVTDGAWMVEPEFCSDEIQEKCVGEYNSFVDPL